jgi:nucleotide-binding universal stress UspA family protein
MTIKNILVSYNGTESSDSALKLALKMAAKYSAHLTGIISYGPSRIRTALGPWVTPELIGQIETAEADRRGEVAKKFREKCAEAEAARPGKVHFLDLGGDADESLMEAGRYYDIIVMGQYDSDPETSHLTPHPDSVALRSGRPVLVVPIGYETEVLGERAVLGWDGGRSAARALSDAMAILESKSMVTILTIGENEAAKRKEGRDVVAHLARHGVMTDWKNVPRNGGTIGRIILDMCDEKEAGILVMGAYEHSKFSEDILGGATKEVLKNTRIPVLMSH